eukprot:1888989-Pyramimonas_sp.AAC.1
MKRRQERPEEPKHEVIEQRKTDKGSAEERRRWTQRPLAADSGKEPCLGGQISHENHLQSRQRPDEHQGQQLHQE